MTYELIRKIVAGACIRPGEQVLVHFWGEDGDSAPAEFMAAVAEAGASPLLLRQSREVNRRLFAAAKDGCFDGEYFRRLSGFDTVLDVFAYQPVVLGADIGTEGMARYRGYMAALFEALMGSGKFLQIRLPTAANAEESGLAPGEFIPRLTAAYDVDCGALKAACEEKLRELDGVRRLTLWTGNGCGLTFTLTGRRWLMDAGEGDWPCGEVYIPPVEEETEGAVYFEQLYVEDAGRFDHVTLQVERGLVTQSSDDGLSAFLSGLSREDRVVCELGFGMNPGITGLCGYAVLDEKMAGTFHIALGANHMFGGKNRASVHIDLVGRGRPEFGQPK